MNEAVEPNFNPTRILQVIVTMTIDDETGVAKADITGMEQRVSKILTPNQQPDVKPLHVSGVCQLLMMAAKDSVEKMSDVCGQLAADNQGMATRLQELVTKYEPETIPNLSAKES